jgi:hypothetical protein
MSASQAGVVGVAAVAGMPAAHRRECELIDVPVRARSAAVEAAGVVPTSLGVGEGPAHGRRQQGAVSVAAGVSPRVLDRATPWQCEPEVIPLLGPPMNARTTSATRSTQLWGMPAMSSGPRPSSYRLRACAKARRVAAKGLTLRPTDRFAACGAEPARRAADSIQHAGAEPMCPEPFLLRDSAATNPHAIIWLRTSRKFKSMEELCGWSRLSTTRAASEKRP